MIKVTRTDKTCSICGCRSEVQHIDITTHMGGHTMVNLCDSCRQELITRIECAGHRCGDKYMGAR